MADKEAMRAMLGETGTEQFTIEVYQDGRQIKKQPIHDPFIFSTTHVGLSRWQHLRRFFFPKHTKIEVILRGSPGAQRAIMTLDPNELTRATYDITKSRAAGQVFATAGQTLSPDEASAGAAKA